MSNSSPENSGSENNAAENAELEATRRFLVVVDDSDEMIQALHFAAKRACRTNGDLVLLYIREPIEFQHWLGVEALMAAESEEAADARLQEVAIKARQIMGRDPELLIREGRRAQTLVEVLKQDQSISIVVLGASTDAEGPGPILSYLIGKNGPVLRTPVTVVPGHLSLEEIDALT